MPLFSAFPERITYLQSQQNLCPAQTDSSKTRWRSERTAVWAEREVDKFRQRHPHLAERDSHVLVRNRVEFLACFLVKGSRPFEISTLGVQNRDRGLDQSLVEELHLTIRALPDFLPRLMAFEKAPLVEEVDPLLVKIFFFKQKTAYEIQV